MEDADYFEGSAAEWGNEADGGTVSACGRLRRRRGGAAGAGCSASGLEAACEGERSGEWRASPEGCRLVLRGGPGGAPGPPSLCGRGEPRLGLRAEAKSGERKGGRGSPPCGGAWGLRRLKRRRTTARRRLFYAPSLLSSRICLGSGSLAVVNRGV